MKEDEGVFDSQSLYLGLYLIYTLVQLADGESFIRPPDPC